MDLQDTSAEPRSTDSSSASAFSSGVANIANQVHYLASRRPLQFNILTFGEAALGKTSMLNSILGSHVFSNNPSFPATNSSSTESGINGVIRIRKQELDERGVRVQLGIVDIPELGQTIRKADCWERVSAYVHDQHLRWLSAETSAIRPPNPTDTRIHLTLYFLNPNNYKLSDLDVTMIGRLAELTNVILVIPKADTLLRHELHRLKYNVRDQLREHRLKLFKPTGQQGEAEPFICLNGDDGQQTVGRTYPWGFVRRTQSNVKLTASSGVNELSTLLFRSFLPEILEQTEVLYEETRAKFLQTQEGKTDPLYTLTSKLDRLVIKSQA
jgi:septin family protein